jgi:hypothetical protein
VNEPEGLNDEAWEAFAAPAHKSDCEKIVFILSAAPNNKRHFIFLKNYHHLCTDCSQKLSKLLTEEFEEQKPNGAPGN